MEEEYREPIWEEVAFELIHIPRGFCCVNADGCLQVVQAFQSLLREQIEALVRERGCGPLLINAAGSFFLRYLASRSAYRFPSGRG